MPNEPEEPRIQDLDSMLESFYNLTLEKRSGLSLRWLGLLAFLLLAFGVAFNTFQWREHTESGDHTIDHLGITRQLATHEEQIATLKEDVGLLKTIGRDVAINQKLLRSLETSLEQLQQVANPVTEK